MGGLHNPIEGLIQRSFGGGELAPAMAARADQAKYVAGLRTCRNFIVQRAGGVANRPGLRFVDECKFASPTVQLLCYYSETAGESILIECGAGYLRFYKNGALVTIAAPPAYNGATAYVIGDLVSDAGVNYYCRANSTGNAPPNVAFWYALDQDVMEVPTGFAGDLPSWSQSGRTITFTHHSHPAQELIYEAVTRWIIRDLNPQPTTAAPQNLVLTPGAVGTRVYRYVVTAARLEDYEESYASGQAFTFACAEPTPDLPNVLSWDDPAMTGLPPAAEYYVYCDNYDNGIYGFIGTAAYLPVGGTTILFRDTGFVPDFTVTPPIVQDHFAVAGEYPSCVAHYKQRRFFGNTDHAPDAVFASRVGFPSNFAISSPLQDDDALIFRLAANQHNPVRHLIGLKQLIVLTDTGEWNVIGGDNGVLTPNAINADQQGYVGAADVRPVVVGNSLIYLQARGRIIRDLQFDQAVEGLAGRDLTVFSSHLFDKYKIRALEYQQTPHSIVWAVRDDGVLLGCTYLREQEVWGWHRHTTGALAADGITPTNGFFWSIAVVPEADQDALYCIVRRTINGSTVRYVEKLERRDIVNFDEDCFFVDSGLSYSGVPVNNVAGLNHLEGKVVAVVGDGGVVSRGDGTAPVHTVVAGTLSPALAASYSNIHVGLPYQPQIETLDSDVQGSAVRDKKRRVGPLDVLVDDSSRSFQAGPDATHLRSVVVAPFEPTGDEFSGQIEINIPSTFNKYGRVVIRQPDPLPLTVLAVIPHVELGG